MAILALGMPMGLAPAPSMPCAASRLSRATKAVNPSGRAAIIWTTAADSTSPMPCSWPCTANGVPARACASTSACMKPASRALPRRSLRRNAMCRGRAWARRTCARHHIMSIRAKAKTGWITISVDNDAEWQRLCQAMGNPDWALETRFASALSRWQNRHDLDHASAEWDVDVRQGPDQPCGPYVASRSTAKDLSPIRICAERPFEAF